MFHYHPFNSNVSSINVHFNHVANTEIIWNGSYVTVMLKNLLHLCDIANLIGANRK